MGFLDLIFRKKPENENRTKGLRECTTPEQRKEWFARTPPWRTLPAWFADDVVEQLTASADLELFVNTALDARLVPQLATLTPCKPRSVSCATISGFFLRAGSPVVQELLRNCKGSISPSRRGALARDCLKVALALFPDPPSAHWLLTVLLVRMDQFRDALQIAEDGLWRVQEAIEQLDPDSEFDREDEEHLKGDEQDLKKLVDMLNKRLSSDAAKAEKAKPGGDEHAPLALVEYSRDRGKRGPDWMLNNVDPILGLYFSPKPEDAAWSQISAENVAAYQLWFQRALLRGELHKEHSSEALVGPRAEAVCKTAFEAKEQHGLNPLLILVLAHQYVEADLMVRGLHTTDWVAFMMSRNNSAPSPESIARFVTDFYGLQKAS